VRRWGKCLPLAAVRFAPTGRRLLSPNRRRRRTRRSICLSAFRTRIAGSGEVPPSLIARAPARRIVHLPCGGRCARTRLPSRRSRGPPSLRCAARLHRSTAAAASGHRTDVILLHGLLQMRRLLLERRRPRRTLRTEEMLRPIVVNCRRRCRPAAGRQTGVRGHHRHVPRHHASVA